ncbi:peptidoglycan binding domain-containing protein [Colletotrichum asianum]
MAQIVYYHRGAGTDKSLWAKALGGLFGTGVVADIADVYRFVCDNYNTKDEIVFIGFSRGAFTARSVAGMVCAIGLLNGFGLANFGAIYKDYSNFSNWTAETEFDPDQHLLWWNVANVCHAIRSEEPGAQISEEDIEDFMKLRKAVFEALTGHLFSDLLELVGGDDEGETKEERLQDMADLYQSWLHCFGMVLKQKDESENTPSFLDSLFSMKADATPGEKTEKVKVKAVGVWDTVGSLGVPYDPRTRDRSDDEIRFASHNVHDRIENAFHALALDETRGPFKPTLWNLPKVETKLQDIDDEPPRLRQVWFPGCHSDVGGGLDNQQIATISLAWMADQLTSVGVEFNPEEMKRIFLNTELDSKWALGRITKPEMWTGMVDKVQQIWTGPEGKRTPGMNTADGKDSGKPTVLTNTNELIHPSVRMRYLYGGKGPNGVTEWKCESLTNSRYVLTCIPASEPEQDEREDKEVKGKQGKKGKRGKRGKEGDQVKQAEQLEPIVRPEWARGHYRDWSTYETLAGNVTSICGGTLTEVSSTHKVVPKQLPLDQDLYNGQSSENWTWELANGSVTGSGKTWVWRREAPEWHWPCNVTTWPWKSHTDCKAKCPTWVRETTTLHEERIGMWERQFLKILNKDSQVAPVQFKPGFLSRFASGTPKFVRKIMKNGYNVVSGVVQGTGRFFWKTGAVLGNKAVVTFEGYKNQHPMSKTDVLAKLPSATVAKYGYHDLIAWQRGDMRKT